MKATVSTLVLALLSATPVLAAQFPAASPQSVTVDAATAVLNEIMQIPAQRIPHRLLSRAHGIAIIPNLIKGGFVVGIRHGKGVVLVRDPSGAWQPPHFISMTGGSVGFQAGLQATDVILVFKSPKSVQGLLNGKFTIGGDAAAAAGPVGRQASAATDAQLRAEIYSYSRSRGLFAGVSLDGSVIEVDQLANSAFYATAPGGLPPSAARLLGQVATYTGSPQAVGPEAIITPSPTPATPNLSAPPAASMAGPSLAAATGQADQIRRQLADASTKLQPILDENWKTYLALPATVYSTTDFSSLEVLSTTLRHFDSVTSNPSYARLSSRTEFQTVHQLLRQYVGSLSSQASNTLELPPPPAGNFGPTPAQKRY